MVLSDLSLWKLLNDLVRDPEPDPDLVNPASIDVRVGREMLLEVGPGEFRAVDLTGGPVDLAPGELALVPTLEWLAVPQGYAVELTLKSLGASQGLAQSMATWLEPGWCGVATLELRNVTRHTPVRIECGMRLAQVVVHALDQPAARPHREPTGFHAEGRRQ
jgi:deoxycytidine triphosphate deaminase